MRRQTPVPPTPERRLRRRGEWAGGRGREKEEKRGREGREGAGGAQLFFFLFLPPHPLKEISVRNFFSLSSASSLSSPPSLLGEGEMSVKGGDRGKKRRRRSSSLKEPFLLLLLLNPVAAASAAAPWQEEPLTPPEPPLAQWVPPRRGAGQGRGGGPRGGGGRGEWAGKPRGGDFGRAANGGRPYNLRANGASGFMAKSLPSTPCFLSRVSSLPRLGGGRREGECGGAGDNGEVSGHIIERGGGAKRALVRSDDSRRGGARRKGRGLLM